MRCWLLALLALACVATQAAERIVTLAPSLTEIILELDGADRLVGVLDAGPRPAEFGSLTSVGRYGQVDIERLIALRPDLLLMTPGSVGAAQRDQLKRLNIPSLEVDPHSLDALAAQFEVIGERIGRPRQGSARAMWFRDGLQQLRQRYHREHPLRVFYQVWDSPLYTVGGGQIISTAIEVCGGRNVFADLVLPAPQVSVEAVLLRDPEVILASTQAQLEAWRRWTSVQAVREGRLLIVPDNGLERPSGQMLGAVARLCAVMAPDL